MVNFPFLIEYLQRLMLFHDDCVKFSTGRFPAMVYPKGAENGSLQDRFLQLPLTAYRYIKFSESCALLLLPGLANVPAGFLRMPIFGCPREAFRISHHSAFRPCSFRRVAWSHSRCCNLRLPACRPHPPHGRTWHSPYAPTGPPAHRAEPDLPGSQTAR